MELSTHDYPCEVLVIAEDAAEMAIALHALEEIRNFTGFYVISWHAVLAALYHADAGRRSPRPSLIVASLRTESPAQWHVLKTIKQDTSLNRIPLVRLVQDEENQHAAHLDWQATYVQSRSALQQSRVWVDCKRYN